MSSQIVTMRYGLPSETSANPSSDWTLLGKTTVTTSSTSTTATSVGTITLPKAWTASKVIWVRVRDQAGKRAGYFYGSDCIFLNYRAANGQTNTLTYAGRIIHRVASDGTYAQYPAATTTGYGVYGYSITSAGVVNIYRRYNSNYSLTINGTYDVEVYSLNYPSAIYS